MNGDKERPFFKGYNPSYYFRKIIDERNKLKLQERSDTCYLRNMCANRNEYCNKCTRYVGSIK